MPEGDLSDWLRRGKPPVPFFSRCDGGLREETVAVAVVVVVCSEANGDGVIVILEDADVEGGRLAVALLDCLEAARGEDARRGNSC